MINYEKNVIKQCFKNDKALLYSKAKIKSPNVFESEYNRFIYQAYIDVSESNVNITKSSMKDYFNQTGNGTHYDQWERLISADYEDEKEYKYHVNQLIEAYTRKFLSELSFNIRDSVEENYATEDIINDVMNSVLTVRSVEASEVTFKSAIDSLKERIKTNMENEGSNFLATGNYKFDQALKIKRDRAILFAAQKKVGKSRFVIDLVDKLIENNDNIKVLFYSLEIDEAEMASFFISRRTGIYPDDMMSMNKKIGSQDLETVNAAMESFKDCPIEFVCGKVSISDIESQFTQFTKRHEGFIPILVIDNLGLIKKHVDNEVAFYDDIALRLQHLKSETKSIQFQIHHLSKASESHYNKDKLYEPGTKDIRSSGRLADYVSQVVLFHRFEKYEDVMESHPELRGKFLVKIAENRYGSEDRIMYECKLGLSRFKELGS